MKIRVYKDLEQMSIAAGMELITAANKGFYTRTNISITAGKTPSRMYEIVSDYFTKMDIEGTHYYNFDEIPVKGEKIGITMNALNKAFFEKNKISKENIHVYDENNYIGYDEVLANDGGLDMIMIGIGMDGHFCGNLSGTLNDFSEGSRKVATNINETIKERIAFLVGGKDKMTEYYVTYGPKTVMEAKKIVLIVSGKEKAEILKKALEGPICKEIPSSILQLHPNLVVISDADAASLLKTN